MALLVLTHAMLSTIPQPSNVLLQNPIAQMSYLQMEKPVQLLVIQVKLKSVKKDTNNAQSAQEILQE
jgi:hypothetical protein